MKNLKFMLVAFMAMVGMNASAATWVSGQVQTKNNIQYTVITVYKNPDASNVNTVSCKANSFTGAALEIPGKVTLTVDVSASDDATPDVVQGDVEFTVVEIEEDGFINNTNITSVSIPATVTTIGAFAFEGCENLASVTLAEKSNLVTIGDGAFAYTSLTTLDLTNATANPNGTANVADDGMRAFGWKTTATLANQTGSPFISTKTGHTTNLMIKEVKLPETCTTINAGAFKDSKNLATIDLTQVIDIKANAFENCAKLASVAIGTDVVFPAGPTPPAATNSIKIGADAFKGCAKLATVELGTLIATADIDDAAFAQSSAAALQAKVETFTFNEIRGNISATAFNLPTVRTLNFNKYIAGAYIVSGAFQAAFPAPTETAVNTINYTYSDRGTTALVNAFATTAFAATAPATNTITMNTTSEFEQNYANTINKVDIQGNYSADVDICNATTKKLVKDKNSSNYYYFTTIDGGTTGVYKSILKEQEKSGATVYVYQAYMDVVDGVASVYFMPVRVKAGKYVIGAAAGAIQTFIVKSNQEDAVVASPDIAGNSTVVSDGSGVINDLKNTGDAAYSLLKVQTDANMMNGGTNDVWFFNNPASSGFGFTKFNVDKQTGGLGKNCVYMTCPATAAARLNIIWLDEEGNTTAIQKVENKSADNGAIYNLRGEKVNASYKGLVIKNGKKMIQK